MSILKSILETAFCVIPRTTISYRKFVSRTVSDFGTVTNSYGADGWIAIGAVVEPGIVSSFGGKGIELRDYKEMGLDWTMRYITVWMPDRGLEPASASRAGADEVQYHGNVFSVLQVENWDDFNGWQRVYCVENKSKGGSN